MNQVGKTQLIRIFDFTMLGPGLIAYGIFRKNLSPLERFFFIGIGTGTTGYNFYNWKKQQEILKLNEQTK